MRGSCCSSPGSRSPPTASWRCRACADNASTESLRPSKDSSRWTSIVACTARTRCSPPATSPAFRSSRAASRHSRQWRRRRRSPSLAGAALVPHPFRPVLRGLLLTGGEPQYLRRDLSGSDGSGVGERFADLVAADEDRRPPTRPLPRVPHRRRRRHRHSAAQRRPLVHVPLDAAVVTVWRPCSPTCPLPRRRGHGAKVVGSVMTADPLLFPPSSPSTPPCEDARARRRLGARRRGRAADGDPHGAGRAARRCRRRDPSERPRRQWMTASPSPSRRTTTLDAAEALMTEYGIHHLPVVEAGGRWAWWASRRDTLPA